MVLIQLQELVEAAYSLDGNAKELPPIPWELLHALTKSDKGIERERERKRGRNRKTLKIERERENRKTKIQRERETETERERKTRRSRERERELNKQRMMHVN